MITHLTHAISKACYEACPHDKRENGILADEMRHKKHWEPLLETFILLIFLVIFSYFLVIFFSFR